jgi:hypothetical protein
VETGCQGGQGSPRAVAPGGWMDVGPGVKYPLFLSGYNGTGIFFTDFRKISK